jgi:hypothetical protein
VNNEDLKGLLGFDWPLSKSDVVNENCVKGVATGAGFLNGKGSMYEGDNSEAVKKIMEKQASGEPVTAQDLKDLTMTILQKSTLPKEVREAIKNDPEAFEELAGRAFDFGRNGKLKLDITDIKSIQKYANNKSNLNCVTASLYNQMVVNGVTGTPGSFGDFTKQLIAKELINPDKPARQIEPTQSIIDAFAGEKGKFQVVGYGQDTGGGYFNNDKSIKGQVLLDKLLETAKNNQDIKFFNVRIDSPHNMNLYKDNGNLMIYDTSHRGFNRPYNYKK